MNPASVPFVPGTIATNKKGSDTGIHVAVKNGKEAPFSFNGSDENKVNAASPLKTGLSSAPGSNGKKGIFPPSSSNVPNGSQPDYDDLKSPISLIHESALKRNNTVHFDIIRETGPPHMRIFITKCIMGDFVTQGEGNGKKV